MTNPNDSAYPMTAGPLLTEDGFTNPIHKEEYGLTKREYFAAMAMQGMLASDAEGLAELKAEYAVAFADALIAKLNKEVKP